MQVFPSAKVDLVNTTKPRSVQSVVSANRRADQIPVSAITWSVLDVVACLICALLAIVTRIHHFPPGRGVIDGSWALIHSAFGLSSIWLAACVVFFTSSYGLYHPLEGRSALSEARMTAQAVLVSGLVVCGTLYLVRGGAVARSLVLETVLFSGIVLCAGRAAWRNVVYARHRQGIASRNVLIVGGGAVGHALRIHLESLSHFGFRFKGFIPMSNDEALQGGPDVVGTLQTCIPIARSLFVDEIFISHPADKQEVLRIVEEAREHHIDVRVIPDLYDGLAWNARIEYVGNFPTIPLHRRQFKVGSFVLKRILDLSLCVAALIVLAPLFCFIAALVKLDSRGPVFYGAERIGRKGRRFACMKFRSMVSNADALRETLEHLNERDGILFKVANDPRITTVGRFLRKYSLDELPQLWNVIKGDMSLVGPRPPIASEVQKYELSHLRRLDVLPGITGLWQVEARQNPSFDSYISLDTAYVENWSIWLDLKILLKTIAVVFSGTGS